MSEPTLEEIKVKVLGYLTTVDKAKNRDVAKAINVEKALTDKAINELAKEDKLEFLYLGTSFVTLKGKSKG